MLVSQLKIHPYPVQTLALPFSPHPEKLSAITPLGTTFCAFIRYIGLFRHYITVQYSRVSTALRHLVFYKRIRIFLLSHIFRYYFPLPYLDIYLNKHYRLVRLPTSPSFLFHLDTPKLVHIYPLHTNAAKAKSTPAFFDSPRRMVLVHRL